MSPEKWEQREEKLRKKREAMRVSGRSVFVLQEILKKKADEARRKTSKKKRSKQRSSPRQRKNS
jgi:hypothetical protein